MEHMRCNKCAAQMAPQSVCIAASCNHLFCPNCAKDVLEADDPCPLCEGPITRSNIKQVTIMQNSSVLQLSLCGQTPHTIMESALAGIKFFCEQQKLNAQFDHNQLSKKFTRMQSQCKAKLEQVHQGYLQAKRRYQETVQEKNGIQADINELTQKYQQKSLQTRKLQEMVKALQQENEDLKRRFACGGGGRSAGSGGGMHTAGGVQLSTSGRQPSPFGSGPMQMITTIQQRKSVIELSPTPGGGAFLGHGSATVPQQRPGTAGAGFGRNMFAPGSISPGGLQPALAGQQRPNTSGGGMFGSAGGNRMGGGGGGGIGSSMRLMPRGGSLGLASPNGMLSM